MFLRAHGVFDAKILSRPQPLLPESFYRRLCPAQTPGQRLELDRKGETIVLEPYAPNILRVTLSLKRDPALAAPGIRICRYARSRRLERKPDPAGRRVPSRPYRGHRGTRPAQHPAAHSDSGGHRQVLQRLRSGRAHHAAHA
jgi:hypothetical protein